MPNGTVVPEREGYPQPSEWGRCAWSFPVRERDFVFGLATRMAAMDGPYGAWVREQLTLHAQKRAAHFVEEAKNAQAHREESKERVLKLATPFPQRSAPFLAAP